MNFYFFDIILLIIFLIFISIFLYRNRKKLDREGILFIYRTKWGVKFIEKFSKKNKSLLNFLSYVSIIFGYIFMVFSIFFLIYSLKFMYSSKILPNVPPIMPIIPYVTQIFKIKFLPPLYFIYWMIILLVVAVSHEFAHGIFARFFNIKIRSTGFGFLGPFILAFVEPDEKTMQRKKIKQQLAILSGGSFANFIVALVFVIIIQLFLLIFSTPIGIQGYFFAAEYINISSINSFDGYTLIELINNSNISFPLKVNVNNQTYFLTKDLWEIQKKILKENETDKILLYLDSPAYRSNLTGAIIKIDGKPVKDLNEIYFMLKNKKPGDTVNIITDKGNYTITLSEHPKNSSKGFLGISFIKPNKFAYFFSFQFFKFNPYIKIKPKINSDVFNFFKDLFYWMILIAISVALFNMLPFSFLDGGRTSYLTLLYFLKNKKKASVAYYIFNFLIVLLILLMFFIWLVKI